MTGPRIPPLPRDQWTDAARDVFAYWEGAPARESGSRSNTMMTLAWHPALALPTLDLGRHFMLGSTLSAREQKMIVLRVAHRYGSIYQWTHNTAAARQLGMSEAEIEGLRVGPEDPVWPEEDLLLLRAVDQTGDGGRIDDATWAALADRWSIPRIMDVVHATGYFTMVAWGLVAMGVEVEGHRG
ncbi:MAG: carboxymuconolactone decarboxylase family protein [Sphingomonadales bacterium]|nr:carboxymuconolactone decarboxylase family protein [Sphingomonadales bacterium]